MYISELVRKYLTPAFYDFSWPCMLCTVCVAVLPIQTAPYFLIFFAKYITLKVVTSKNIWLPISIAQCP